MKKYYTFFFSLFVLLTFSVFAQKSGQQNPGYKTKWTTNPFDSKLFVENKGQFNNAIHSGKVLFEAKLGHINAFFTPSGIVYQYCVRAKQMVEGKDPDMVPEKDTTYYMSQLWDGSNPGVVVNAQQEQTYYYTYPLGADSTVKANVFKKITYRNLYPGIDAEYTFPKDKPGIKYTLVIHPGADISKIKLKYEGATSIKQNAKGEVVIETTDMDVFTEHTPISNYSKGGKVDVRYNIIDNEESFVIKGGYDKNKTIVIDPWTTNPGFTKSPDRAYDVDYDNLGNVYVYGGGGPYQLVKLNSAGTIQWTYNNTFFWARETDYSDFAVDKVTGTCYVVEGVGGPGFGTAADALKINTLGVKVGTFTGNAHLTEMWRAIYNSCNKEIIVGGGGISYPFQACILDTGMKKITPINILPKDTMPYHDVVLMAVNPPGTQCFMATARNDVYDTNFDNELVRLPVPTLTPPAFMVHDGYDFHEVNSVYYAGNPAGFALENAMNGMGVSLNWLYTYDSYTLKRFNPNTGALTKAFTITPPVIKVLEGGFPASLDVRWGGLDVDLCDNLYAGVINNINIYDSTLTQTGSIIAADTLYDIVLGANYTTLYACGVGFVSSISIPASLNPKLTVTKTPSCTCGGAATANLMLCGGPATNATYLWSPGGQTTQTAINLCPGTYTVTVSPACDMFFTDSVTFLPSTINPVVSGNDTICQGESTTITVFGGASYQWSTGATSSVVNVSPIKDSTYKVVVSDTSGCHDTVKVPITVNPKPKGTVSSAQSVCKGDSVHLSASGGITYIWKPSTGLSSSTSPNPTAVIKGSETYTVYISNGKCWDTLSTVVNVSPPPVITVCCSDTIPYGESTTLHVLPNATGSTYAWTPSTGLSCTNCPDPVASPSVPTMYYVTLTDSSGCVSMDSVYVDVNGCATIWLPNAFTPNGDGRNDVFYPKGGGCIEYVEMYIFDRWGMMCYHSFNQAWDGTVKGQKAEEDTYVYLITTTDYKGNNTSYMGKVSLIK